MISLKLLNERLQKMLLGRATLEGEEKPLMFVLSVYSVLFTCENFLPWTMAPFLVW